MSNDKETPKKCEATLCCRATAELQVEIQSDLQQPDPQNICTASLDNLIQSIKITKDSKNADKDS